MNEWGAVHTLTEWVTGGLIFIAFTVIGIVSVRLMTFIGKKPK